MITGLVLYLACLVGAGITQAVASAFRALEHTRSTEELRAIESFFVYRSFQRLFFHRQELEVLFFCISCTKEIVRFGLVVGAMLFFTALFQAGEITALVLSAIVALALALSIGDFLPRYWGLRHPITALHVAAPAASLFLLLASPVCYATLLVAGRRFSTIYVEQVREPVEKVKEKILEMLEQAGEGTAADRDEREMLESVVELRDTTVREIMIPRVDMFCLSEETAVRQAAEQLDHEGYSRAPVYRESIDHIEGLLFYKDIARLYVECEQRGDMASLDRPISSCVKPVLFVPETSRVSRLLEDFRRRQTHMAIVVDEYGGTEGLVTIEDCLEEIVGEIADEYDEEEELYAPSREGGWIVDARMSISDIEEKFGIEIPQEGEYDTIGGFAFHKAGEIPAKGLRIEQDNFELEILESSERCVEKVWIKPTSRRESLEDQ